MTRTSLLQLFAVTTLMGCNLGEEPGLRGADTDATAEDSISDSVVTADSDAATDAAEVGGPKTKVIAYPDFNGDGRADLWCYGPKGSANVGHFDVFSSAATNFEFENGPSLFPWATEFDQWAGTGDFDGDGVSEVFKSELIGGRFHVARMVDGALKDVFALAEQYCNGYETIIGDFDGDHRQDLACINEVNRSYDKNGGNVWIVKSLSTAGIFSFEAEGVAVENFCDWTTSRDNVQATWGAGKIDGDVLDDVWCHDLRTGPGFAGRTIWAKSDGKGKLEAQSISLLEGFCSGPSLHFGAADFDGDGDLDFYCHHPVGADATSVGQIEVALNDGGKFASIKVWHPSWCTRPKARIGTGDFDGDGKADLYCHDDVGTTFALAKGTTFLVQSEFLAGCTFDRNELHSRD